MGEPFPLQAELDEKLDRMAALVEDLRGTEGVLPKVQAKGAKASHPAPDQAAA